jgi:HEPN domain-containing protein
MNREGLQLISRQRRREAAVLLRAGLFAGAYYLAGYSVECALKASIAQRTKRHDFPDRGLAIQAWTHDLQRLIGLAGMWEELQQDIASTPALRLNWTIVRDWSEAARYDATITEAKARELYAACTQRQTGLLSWIRRRW